MKPDEDIAHILPIPNLDEFRRLPVIKIYEAAGPSPAGSDSSSSSSFPRSLKDPFVASVLNENLNQWRENARAALAGVLGFPGWRTHSQRKLHPVDRLSARFRCKRCDACPAAGRAPRIPLPEDGGMDFAEACEHTCAHLQKKKKARDQWSADRFAVDQKVVVPLFAFVLARSRCPSLPFLPAGLYDRPASLAHFSSIATALDHRC